MFFQYAERETTHSEIIHFTFLQSVSSQPHCWQQFVNSLIFVNLCKYVSAKKCVTLILTWFIIFNKKSILTVKEAEKLNPNWIYIKRNREGKKPFHLNAFGIQWTWENGTWLHCSWGHLHLSSESLPGPFIALTSTLCCLLSHSASSWILMSKSSQDIGSSAKNTGTDKKSAIFKKTSFKSSGLPEVRPKRREMALERG